MKTDTFNQGIGKRAKQARIERGLSLFDLSAMTDIPEKRLMLCEEGIDPFRFHELEAIRVALHCTQRYLIWNRPTTCFDEYAWRQLYGEEERR